jgi:hypothetical protein
MGLPPDRPPEGQRNSLMLCSQKDVGALSFGTQPGGLHAEGGLDGSKHGSEHKAAPGFVVSDTLSIV